jgi:hypothetical protein
VKDLRRVFLNPPKGGNEVGVQTESSMAPFPGPMGAESCPIGAYDGGKSLQAQREERELARMSPDQKYERMGRQWEERERRKANPSGPDSQTSIRESFEKGEQAARNNVVQSGRVGQPEFRNYDRGRIPVQTTDDPSAIGAYDYSSVRVGSSHGTFGSHEQGGQGTEKATRPELRPNTRMPYRSDGKPHVPQGGNSGEPAGGKFDKNGGV